MPTSIASTPILDALLKDREIDPEDEEQEIPYQLNIPANTRGNPYDAGTSHMTNAEFFGQLHVGGPTIDSLREARLQDRKDAIRGFFNSVREGREQETERQMKAGENIKEFFSGLFSGDSDDGDKPVTRGQLMEMARRGEREAKQAARKGARRDVTALSIPAGSSKPPNQGSAEPGELGIPAPSARPTSFGEDIRNDVQQFIQRNPVLSAVASVAGAIGPGDIGPGGAGKAAMRFIPRRAKNLKGVDEVVEFFLKDPDKPLSPTVSGLGRFDEGGRAFMVDIMDTRGPAGMNTLRTARDVATEGVSRPTVGRRGILEGLTDFLRQNPKVERLTSTNRITGKGTRGMQYVDRPISQGLRSRADQLRAAEGTGVNTEALNQLDAFRILTRPQYFEPEDIAAAEEFLSSRGVRTTSDFFEKVR